jgi:hypothetical protein
MDENKVAICEGAVGHVENARDADHGPARYTLERSRTACGFDKGSEVAHIKV